MTIAPRQQAPSSRSAFCRIIALASTVIVLTGLLGLAGGPADATPTDLTIAAQPAPPVLDAQTLPLAPQISAGNTATCVVDSTGRPTCWGSLGAAFAYPPVAEFASVSVGDSAHVCGVKVDDTVACWGDDSNGQSSPPGGAFTSVSAGGFHTCGLRPSAGAVTCWGFSGDGATTPPTASFVSVDAGASHTCGVKTNGDVACWGDNTDSRATPPSGQFLSVSAGGSHSCGVRTNGTVACWGLNTGSQATPPTGIFTSVSAGAEHTCGVRADATLACWGTNGIGQVLPEATPPAGTFTAAVAAGAHSCGVKTDRTVTCWGDGDNAQLVPPLNRTVSMQPGIDDFACGLGSTSTLRCWGNNYNAQASPPLGAYSDTDSGIRHSCALRSDQIVKCWGDNTDNQLFTSPSNTFIDVDAGGYHSCGVRTVSLDLQCVGDDSSGQSTPPTGDFQSVSAGWNHSCARRTNSTVVCWGDNTAGKAVAPAGTFQSVSAGGDHTCGLLADGTLQCWGSNGSGESSPPTGTFTSVSASMATSYSCGLRTNGTVACWGDPSWGVLEVPSGSFQSVSAGGQFACGVTTGGLEQCWGRLFKVGGPIVSGTSAGHFVGLAPARILDTRSGGGPVSSTRDVTVAGVGGVAATGVSAVVLNVTVTQPQSAEGFSWLTVWPSGAAKPSVSNLNMVNSQTVANLVTVKVGANGKVSVANQFGSAHVIFDVVGYYSDGTLPAGSRFNAVASPTRLFDSRTSGAGGSAAKFTAGEVRGVVVAGVSGVPVDATSVVVNVTATAGTVNGGYLTLFPKGTVQPTASTVNYNANQDVPNLAVVKVGADRTVNVANPFGQVHVILDVVGYFGPNAAAGSRFVPIVPFRGYDSRSVGGVVPAGATRSVQVTGTGSGASAVPATGVSAVVMNVTSTGSSGAGFLSVYPSGVAAPSVSNLNWAAGETRPNLVVVKVGGDGKVVIGNSTFSSTHVIFDIVGWYRTPDA